MNKKIILTVLVIVLSLIFFCTTVLAQNLQDLQNKKNELQNQINESNEQIEQIEIELTENLQQLNSINEEIYTYQTEITFLEGNLETIENEIKEVSKRLDIVEKKYNLQKEAFRSRMVAIYEAGDIVYLDVLLNSKSISEFISNYYLIGEIAKYDSELLENIGNQKIQIENLKLKLEERQENIRNLKKNKEKATIALENTKVIKNSYINKLSDQEKQTQAKIDEIQSELNSIESQIVMLTAGNIGEDYVGGEFDWPAPGYTTITSPFGMRLHPVLKVNRLHTGTDIATPTGAPIVAANSGVVIKSMYTSGYGNMIMINHGGGVSTVYAHGSEIVAQTGQMVEKGEVIMKAGSTGWSTGPHLHFEIRINGKYIDPLPFITKQSSITNKQIEDGGEN